jgi:hypothetical protein
MRVRLIIEEDVQIEHSTSNEKLKAVRSINNLLVMIDHLAEEIPLNDLDKLISLLREIKGEPLSKSEIEVIKEIKR